MARSRPDKNAQLIDSLLNQGRRAHKQGNSFAAQAALLEALHLSHQSRDYERMAQAVEPLGEVRQEIRRAAAKTRRVTLIEDDIPAGPDLKPGCYVVQPPRVGIDGRALRELAAAAGVPALVVVREPTTRSGLWPVVALGPVTVRTRIQPPGDAGKTKGRTQKPARTEPKPTPTWVQGALDALAETSLEGVPDQPAATRVDSLLERLGTIPESPALHDELREACLAAQAEQPAEQA